VWRGAVKNVKRLTVCRPQFRESTQTFFSNARYDHNAGLTKAENKSDARTKRLASSNAGMSQINIFSVPVACSAKNCWTPLLNYELRELRSLFYF